MLQLKSEGRISSSSGKVQSFSLKFSFFLLRLTLTFLEDNLYFQLNLLIQMLIMSNTFTATSQWVFEYLGIKA